MKKKNQSKRSTSKSKRIETILYTFCTLKFSGSGVISPKPWGRGRGGLKLEPIFQNHMKMTAKNEPYGTLKAKMY